MLDGEQLYRAAESGASLNYPLQIREETDALFQKNGGRRTARGSRIYPTLYSGAICWGDYAKDGV